MTSRKALPPPFQPLTEKDTAHETWYRWFGHVNTAINNVATGIDGSCLITVADRNELADVNSTDTQLVYLVEAGREGLFLWDSSDLSASVTADTRQGVFVAPTALTTGAAGAWVRQYEELNPTFFGVNIDVAVSQHSAFSDFLTMLGFLDADGRLPVGYIYFTTPVSLSNVSGFRLRGQGDKSVLKNRYTSTQTCITLNGCTDIIFEDFKIDMGFSVTGFANHGLSLFDPTRVRCNRITVTDWHGSAIIMHTITANTFGYSSITNCLALGAGSGVVGFLMVNLIFCYQDNNHAEGFHPTDKHYAHQLKGQCRYCTITNAKAQGASAGVVIGGLDVLGGPGWCRAENIVTKGCDNGAVIGDSTHCYIEVHADMTTSDGTGCALTIDTSNNNVVATVYPYNVTSSSGCSIDVYSDDATIHVPYGSGVGQYLMRLNTGVNRTRLIVDNVEDAITNIWTKINDASGTTTNTVLYMRGLETNEDGILQAGEENGTWTPTYIIAGSTLVHDIQEGYYSRVGDRVTVTGRIRTDTVAGGAGTVTLGGIPYTAKNVTNAGSNGAGVCTGVSFGGDFPSVITVADNSTALDVWYRATANGTITALDTSDMSTGANSNDMRFSVTYLTE